MRQTERPDQRPTESATSQTASPPTTTPELPVGLSGAVWINHCPAYHSQPASSLQDTWTGACLQPKTAPDPSPEERPRPGTRKPQSRPATSSSEDTARRDSARRLSTRLSSPHCLASSCITPSPWRQLLHCRRPERASHRICCSCKMASCEWPRTEEKNRRGTVNNVSKLTCHASFSKTIHPQRAGGQDHCR